MWEVIVIGERALSQSLAYKRSAKKNKVTWDPQHYPKSHLCSDKRWVCVNPCCLSTFFTSLLANRTAGGISVALVPSGERGEAEWLSCNPSPLPKTCAYILKTLNPIRAHLGQNRCVRHYLHSDHRLKAVASIYRESSHVHIFARVWILLLCLYYLSSFLLTRHCNAPGNCYNQKRASCANQRPQ